jgi:CubicO group peptidase (beta-lactamase class C family)
MKKRSVKKGGRKYLIPAAILLVLLFFLFGFNRTFSLSDLDITLDEELPVALNHLLSNDMSNLEETKKMDDQIEHFMRRWEIKGASLAIMKNERLIYAKGYGWADREAGDSTEVRHIFRIASVSKLITAAAIMKLWEDGKLSLSDKIFADNGILNLPQFSEIRDKRVKDITIEQLLRHKGGFSNRAGDPMFNLAEVSKKLNLARAATTDEIISYALSHRLGYQPGSGTRYSNVGYLILSRVIETVSGESYQEYVKKSVLYPAGVYDMHIAGNLYSDKLSNEVKYYGANDEEMVESYDGSGRLMPRWYGGNNIEALLGAGGWVASPSELLKLVAALDGRDNIKDLLSKECIEIMTSSSSSTLPIGWAKCTPNGEWSRTGTLSGTSAMVKYNRNGYSWVFVTNTSSWKGSRFPGYIDAFFRGAIHKVADWPQRDLFEFKTEQ